MMRAKRRKRRGGKAGGREEGREGREKTYLGAEAVATGHTSHAFESVLTHTALVLLGAFLLRGGRNEGEGGTVGPDVVRLDRK